MRVICPHCKRSVVVEKHEKVICPECNQEFNLEEGKALILRTHQYLMTLGYRELNQLGNYEKAAEYFDKLVDITPNDIEAVVGRSLSYLYKATFFESNYKKVVSFFDDCDITLDKKNSLVILSFFEDALHQVNIYLDVTKLRLFEDNKFVSAEYREPYYNGLEELKVFLNFIQETLNIVTEEEKAVYEDSNFENLIKVYLTEVELRLKQEHGLIAEPYSLNNNNICELKKAKPLSEKRGIAIEGVLVFLTVLFIVLGITLKTYFYYIAIAPGVLAVAFGIIFFLAMKKKDDQWSSFKNS